MNKSEALIWFFISIITPVVLSLWVNGEIRIDPFTVTIFVCIAVPTGIANFFRAEKSSPPSKFEKLLANAWLAARKIVCAIGAALFILGAIAFLFSGAPIYQVILVSVFMLFSAYFIARVGIFGRVSQTSSLSEDKLLHEQHKKRYGWRN